MLCLGSEKAKKKICIYLFREKLGLNMDKTPKIAPETLRAPLRFRVTIF